MEQYIDTWGVESIFHVSYSAVRHARDRDNYLVPQDPFDDGIFEDETLERLYERMASYKANMERPANNRGEYTSVVFGNIYQSIAVKEVYADQFKDELNNTAAWQVHLAKQQQAQLAEQAKIKAAADEAQARKVEQDKAQLAKLLEQYGQP